MDNKKLRISELFYSIQGESSYAGFPCFFIRLAECNLRCTFCDSRYTYAEDHTLYSINQILAETNRHPESLVEVTGGEPLLQENVYPLLDELLAAGRTVLLETNGSISLARVPDPVVRIMDVKCPDSGMHERMDFNNFSLLTRKDEIKFVISSRVDYDWAGLTLAEYSLQDIATVTYSPVISEIAPATLAGWILQDHLPVRLRLQLHTIIWPGQTRGY